MKNLKILIWLLENDIETLKRTFKAFYSNYGIEEFDIAGVVSNGELSLQGRKAEKIPLENVAKTSFDYLVVVGLNPEIPNHETLKTYLAEKINIQSASIVFDFEIYNGTFRFPNVCLVVIFNHRFDKNLPLLRKIYGSRFSNIRFLMPFYDGTDSDVIPVYESSYQFQGYLIQAYEKLKDIPCSHYLFIGDDLIINPDFDELNFIARASMHGKKFLSAKFTPVNSPNKFKRWSIVDSSKPFYNRYTSWKDSLYTYEEAMAKFNDFFGVKYKEVYDEAFFGNPNEPGRNIVGKWDNPEDFLKMVNHFIETNKNSLNIPYPMAHQGGVADIFCVSKESLFEISRLCGIFSAMKLFVEIALPTAVVLTFKRNEVEFIKYGLWLWRDNRTAFENFYDKDFNRLYKEWNEKLFCIHPVKLSRWKNI